MEAFSERTINPLKRELKQLLKENKDKQKIINSIISCILSNRGRIKASQIQDDLQSPNQSAVGASKECRVHNAGDLLGM